MDCLVTTLKGIVTGDLPKFKELKLHFHALNSASLAVTMDLNDEYLVEAGDDGRTSDDAMYFPEFDENFGDDNIATLSLMNEPVTQATGAWTPTGHTIVLKSLVDNSVKISQNAHFTDITGTEDYGTVTNLVANEEKTLYFTDGDFDLIISNKYALVTARFGNTGVEGNISSLSGMTALTSLYLYNTGVEGNISSLSGMTALTSLSLGNTGVEGNISSLSGMTALTSLNLGNTGVEGNISSLSGMTALTYLYLKYGKCTGDLSALPDNLYFFSAQYATGAFTWEGTRKSTARVIAMEDVILNSNIDAMLINQANCVCYFGGSEIWFHRLSLKGTRTSASDAAVAALKKMGYTITVNGVVQ